MTEQQAMTLYVCMCVCFCGPGPRRAVQPVSMVMTVHYAHWMYPGAITCYSAILGTADSLIMTPSLTQTITE